VQLTQPNNTAGEAMADYRIKVGFLSHPKTIKLKRRTGAEGVLAFIGLMEYCTVNTSRSIGNFAGLTDEDIEIAARWNGEPGLLADSLIEVGYLDGEEGSRSIHDFVEHQPWLAGARDRSRRARNAAKARWDGEKMPLASDMMPQAEKSMPAAPITMPVAQEGLLPDSTPPRLSRTLEFIHQVWLTAHELAPEHNPEPNWPELTKWWMLKTRDADEQQQGNERRNWLGEMEGFCFYWTKQMIKDLFDKAIKKKKIPQFRLKHRISTWVRNATKGGSYGKGIKSNRKNGGGGNRPSGALDPEDFSEYQ